VPGAAAARSELSYHREQESERGDDGTKPGAGI
jgi:hypothetical protein